MMELKLLQIKFCQTLLLLIVLTGNVSSYRDRRDWWLSYTSKNTVLTTEPSTTTVLPTRVNLQNIVCCECVQFYLCLNGTILSDGSNIIDLRIGSIPSIQTEKPPVVNVDVCPTDDGDLLICCAPPDVDPSCLQATSSPVTVAPVNAPHPDSLCECIVYNDCNPNLVVSNDLGNTAIELPNGRIVSHNKCHHSLEVCCLILDSPVLGSPEVTLNDTFSELQKNVSTINDYAENCQECVPRHLCDSEGYIIEDGSGQVDLRFGRGLTDTFAKQCPHNSSLVCCRLRETTRQPEHTVTPMTTINAYAESCPECVPRFLCDSEGYIIEDGSSQVDLRFGRRLADTFAKPCPHNSSLVCCRLKETTRQPEHMVTPMISIEHTTVAKFKPKLCGTRNFNGIGTRVLGFKESQTQFGEFPWVATLLKSQSIGKNVYPLFLGGASLIHRRAVLTAAHKLHGLATKDLWVRLGEWDVASEIETLPSQDILIEEIIIHPLYNPGPLYHDLAILILKNEAKLDDHVGTVCLPSSVVDIDPSSCVINGWGVDEFASGNYQKLMKSVHIPLVDKQTCQTLLRKTRLSKYFKLHSSFICAGGEEGADACKGDGGGPLACRSKSDPSRYYQAGITAWGIGCGTKDVPGVYVDVTEHFEWINSCLRNRTLEVDSSSPVKESKGPRNSNW